VKRLELQGNKMANDDLIELKQQRVRGQEKNKMQIALKVKQLTTKRISETFSLFVKEIAIFAQDH
jgi:hypothetical protein